MMHIQNNRATTEKKKKASTYYLEAYVAFNTV